MRKIAEFVKTDAKNVFRNVISLVVCVGMIVIPSFYAWFNIAGSWDPYGNTQNLKVAVANNDEGYEGELLPVSINIGQRMEASLRESTSIGYTFVSEEEALEGVRSGEYYAAIVFPSDFTKDMLSVATTSAKKSQVAFYQNEKANAIAAIVTDKASTAVQQDIDASFAEAVTNVGAGVLQELCDYLDDDTLASFASKLDEALDTASNGLTSTGSQVSGFADAISSAQGLVGNGGSGSVSSLSATLDASNGLRQAADGVRSVSQTVSGATDSVNSAISSAVQSLAGVQSSLDQAFESAGNQTDKLVSALNSVKSSVEEDASRLRTLSSTLETARQNELAIKANVDAQLDALDKDSEDEQVQAQYTALLKTSNALQDSAATLEELKETIDSHVTSLDALAQHIGSTADDLAAGKRTAEQARTELSNMVSTATAGISQVQSSFEGDVKSALNNLASTIDGAASDVDSIKASINEALSAVSGASSSASSALDTAKSGLYEAADTLNESATKISNLKGSLEEALNSGDLDTVRKILSSGSTDLASFISEPVEMDRTAIYAIENNGSAMAPFYTTLAIWIGGIVLAALVKCNPSEERIETTGCRPSEAYIGRIVFFVCIGFMQTLVVLLGDMFFLGVQCEHPWLFLLAGLTASLVFVNIIYALTASFGDVGKAIAVILMIIQVAGSGGTFPVQMLPDVFQKIYPFLPFVHSENALRAAMFGVYNGDFWMEICMLLLYLVPALLLGLLLRKPVIRLNEWMEHKLESTKVM